MYNLKFSQVFNKTSGSFPPLPVWRYIKLLLIPLKNNDCIVALYIKCERSVRTQTLSQHNIII